MMTVGAYEAKTHLSQLLQSVAQGDTIIISKNGVNIAQLSPIQGCLSLAEIANAMKKSRKQFTLGDDLDLRQLREEGRA